MHVTSKGKGKRPLQGLFSGRLHHIPKLLVSLIKLTIFTVFLVIFLTINPYPLCQLSYMGGNRRTRRKTTQGSVDEPFPRSDVRYRARTHDLSGGRMSLRRLSHRSLNGKARRTLELSAQQSFTRDCWRKQVPPVLLFAKKSLTHPHQTKKKYCFFFC